MRRTKIFAILLQEASLAAQFAGVGLIGFAVDAVLLHLGMRYGLSAAWARVISLIFAMHVTFLVNGLFVFRCLERGRLARQWFSYMLANGFGNFCNYWIFVTLVSLHWRLVSVPLFAMTVGAFCAWAINFIGTRFWVFRKTMEVLGAATDEWKPQPRRGGAAPDPSSRPVAGGRRRVP